MIGIVNYGAGNIFSLTASLERLGLAFGMINDKDGFEGFDRYIIPGVGHAGTAMGKLNESGMVPAIKAIGKPVLGICVGMQLLTSFSEEGDSDLLGIASLKTLSFSGRVGLKVPHTGWNTVRIEKKTPLFDGFDTQTYFYFVHSYFIEYDPSYTIASTTYEIPFSAAIQADNFYGVQFHPEKSGTAGEQLLTNFSRI